MTLASLLAQYCKTVAPHFAEDGPTPETITEAWWEKNVHPITSAIKRTKPQTPDDALAALDILHNEYKDCLIGGPLDDMGEQMWAAVRDYLSRETS